MFWLFQSNVVFVWPDSVLQDWLLCFNGAYYSKCIWWAAPASSLSSLVTRNQLSKFTLTNQLSKTSMDRITFGYGHHYDSIWQIQYVRQYTDRKLKSKRAVNSSILWIPNQHSLLWIWNGTTQSNNVIMQGLPPKTNSLTCSSMKQG